MALNKFNAKGLRDIKKVRPKGISREVFALMTEEDLIKHHQEGGTYDDKAVKDGDGSENGNDGEKIGE